MLQLYMRVAHLYVPLTLVATASAAFLWGPSPPRGVLHGCLGLPVPHASAIGRPAATGQRPGRTPRRQHKGRQYTLSNHPRRPRWDRRWTGGIRRPSARSTPHLAPQWSYPQQLWLFCASLAPGGTRVARHPAGIPHAYGARPVLGSP